MSRDAIELKSARGRGTTRALMNLMFSLLLTALSTGCVTGTSGASRFSLFAKSDEEVDTCTASMEPAPECPNCSLPVGVVAGPGPVSGQMSAPADEVSHQSVHGVVQPGPAPQSVPAVPLPAQVPPEAGPSVAVNSTSNGPESATAAVTQVTPQTAGTPIWNPAAGNMAVQQPTTTQPVSGPMPTNQQVYGPPGYPVQQLPVVSQMIVTPHAQSNPGGQKTWEQLQLERQRTQQFYSAHSQPMPQQQVMTQQMVPWQAPGCPSGMQPAPGFDSPWHAIQSQQIAIDGSACPPATISSELQSCKDQVDRLSSKIEDLERSNEKALETALILAEQQKRTVEENKMLREAQRAESQRQLEYYDALLNAIGEEEADQSSGQPDPQASTRKSRSARSGSQTAARPVGRSRNQPVTLPSVDE
jgi:hypothetical protein